MSHQVFISYSSRDQSIAVAACAALEAAGVSCWIAERNVQAGTDYTEVVPRAIDGSGVMVVVFSANANRSRHVKTEVGIAFNKPLPIIPLRIENVQPLEGMRYLLGHSQWLDAFTAPLEQNLDRLVTETRRHLDQLPRHESQAQTWSSGAQPVSNYGPLVHKLCDRTSQENAFNQLFKAHSKNNFG